MSAAAGAAPAPGTTLRDVVQRWWTDVKSGELGSLPIIFGLIVIAIVFQSQNDRFLTASNFVNLIVQSAAYTTIAMGIVFVLLLGEIDLSVGYVSGVAGVIATILLIPDGNEVPTVVAIARRARRRRRDRDLARHPVREGRHPVVRGHARGVNRLERCRAAVDRQPRHRDPPGRLHHRPGERVPLRGHAPGS